MYRRNVCVCYTAIAVNAYSKAPSADSQWALNKCYGAKYCYHKQIKHKSILLVVSQWSLKTESQRSLSFPKQFASFFLLKKYVRGGVGLCF